jgi:hypothetical protein
MDSRDCSQDLEVKECIPVTDLKQSDVQDSEAAIQAYSSVYAEELVMVLHTEITQIMDFSVEALNLIDRHFWGKGLAERLERGYIDETLIPAVGAYLGTVLVRQLEGYWIPRQNFLEAQVVVGQVAWLPFLRAQNYLQSKESALDYSLRKFYRAVEDYCYCIESNNSN